jgi:uncharacterized membrane protein
LKDETSTDTVSSAILLILGTASIFQAYKLFNNAFEVVFSTLFEAVTVILVVFSFWVIFEGASTRKNISIKESITLALVVDIPAEASVENIEDN